MEQENAIVKQPGRPGHIRKHSTRNMFLSLSRLQVDGVSLTTRSSCMNLDDPNAFVIRGFVSSTGTVCKGKASQLSFQAVPSLRPPTGLVIVPEENLYTAYLPGFQDGPQAWLDLLGIRPCSPLSQGFLGLEWCSHSLT